MDKHKNNHIHKKSTTHKNTEVFMYMKTQKPNGKTSLERHIAKRFTNENNCNTYYL